MCSAVSKILEQFNEKNCYNNFGACLRRIDVCGFRGIKNLSLNFDFPITAITGLNGAGKSTLGQLAICGYRKPSISNEYKRQYIKDFFPVSRADPYPIADDAEVIYVYETPDIKKKQSVTVSRANSSWSGYKRQPERHCYYIGFTVYIPKVERRDSSVYGGKDIQLTQKRRINESTIKIMNRIIGNDYTEVGFQGVSLKDREFEIGIVSRLGISYSENNMGFGEGRILYTVDRLENSPEKSLFIIEEPETSLHESAQYNFAKYLMNVCLRRHHQIIMSTHSSVIIDALPVYSRKLLIRDERGVEVLNNISSMRIKSILSDGYNNGLIICVEDDFAKLLLCEAIRRIDQSILKIIKIVPMGNTDAVRDSVIYMNRIQLNAIGIRDADIGECPKEKLFSLPGKEAPEKEVFNNDRVNVYFRKEYNIDIKKIINGMMDDRNKFDHHAIPKKISDEIRLDDSIVKTHAVEEYIEDTLDKFIPLVDCIKNYIE